MGLFESIKSVFGGSAAAARRETDRVYIVDAEKLADSRDGRTGPVERFRAIQLLSRFAEREKIELIAVVGGRPLREVAHGEIFNGVRVFYVEENSTVAGQIEKTLGHVRGRRPVVITNDKNLESRLHQRGVVSMRITTLRKAIEGEGGGGNGGGRNQAERRNRQQDRQRQPSAAAPENNGAVAATSKDDPANQTPCDTVDGFIDRVK